jgi:thioredoxin reductase (NADPH)
MPLETLTMSDSNTYDVLIIGGGPAGLSAALYVANARLKVGFIEKNIPGGKLVNIKQINNYLGFDQTAGSDLALKMFEQATQAKAQYIYGNVVSIKQHLNYHVVYTDEGVIRFCKALIIATGTQEKKLNIVGEDKFNGKGISYCALCDGSLATNKNIALVINNKHGLSDLNYLSKIAKHIDVVTTIDIPDKHLNTTIYNDYKCNEFKGDLILNSLLISKNNEVKELKVDFVFLSLGDIPSTTWLSHLDILDENKIIKTQAMGKTTIPGIYAIGDVAKVIGKQIVTAVSDGVLAAIDSISYIKTNFKK